MGLDSRLIDTMRPGRFAAPAPCPLWNVQDLLGRILTVAGRAASAEPAAVRRDFEVAAAWGRPEAAAGSTAGSWGLVTAPVAVAVSGLVLELAALAGDLATALGDRTPIDEELAAFSLGGAAGRPP